MGFQQGLSGLNAASRSLDVTGNNVANASTVGFKQSRAEFADVYANSLNGSGATPIGLGTKVVAVTQQFTQGGITVTNLPLDLAINGGGFFRMSNAGVTTYTRNGQFQLDKNGYVVSAEGYRLQGYLADSTGVIQQVAPPVDLRLFNPSTSSDVAPQATGTSTAGTGISALVNLDSREAAPVTTPFSYTDPTSYNRTTALSIYDSLGNSHTYQMYFVKNTAVAGQWDVYATMTNPASATNPGVLDLSRDANGNGVVSAAEAAAAPVALGSLFFNTSGTLASTTPVAGLVQALTAAQIGSTGINANAMSFKVDFAGSTQFGSKFAVNTLEQDGFTAGSLAGYSVGADGVIVGRYTNGITKNLGQVTLDSFRNPQGLDPIGNNQWVETSDSGAPITGDPGTDGNHGPIQSAATEDSNVDLTQELVNMIIAQRVYQANAQTIKTQDSILQTLVNLR